ncbi:MAG: hypothetical protein ACE5R6_05790 [Candidatus Heimdallarchaeota archaeon]
MVESHERFHDRYRMLMDVYEVNEKLNSRTDEKATALLTLSGAITSIAILLLFTDYMTSNPAFQVSLGILILFGFISMLFFVHAVHPFFWRSAVTVKSNGIIYFKDKLECKDPAGFKALISHRTAF